MPTEINSAGRTALTHLVVLMGVGGGGLKSRPETAFHTPEDISSGSKERECGVRTAALDGDGRVTHRAAHRVN